MRPLRLTYLVESLAEPWGGVSTIRRQVEELAARGHLVTVVSRGELPAPLHRAIEVRTSPDLAPATIPSSDLVIGTFVTTVPYAITARRGVPVHFCQGYEGDNPEYAGHRAWVESVYRRSDVEKIVIAPHLATLMGERFGRSARCVPYPVDHDVVRPRAGERAPGPLRVGVIGPAAVPWKQVAVGCQAVDLAAGAGLDLVLVRVSPIPFDRFEPAVACRVERHAQVPRVAMGDLLRSLDALVACSGPQEGFFLPAMEAMASGVPCVLTRAPCFLGYDPGTDHASFGDVGDAPSVAEALVEVCTDLERRGRQIRQGLAVAARHTWAAHLDAMAFAFEGILGAHGILPARRRRTERAIGAVSEGR